MDKKRTFILLLIVFLQFFSVTSFSQGEGPFQVDPGVFRINFLLPGVSYEQRLASDKTFFISAYTDAFIIDNGLVDEELDLFFSANINGEFRTYYNFAKRSEKGRRTAVNSANYISPLYIGRYSRTGDFDQLQWVNQLGFQWGMQRNGPKHFGLDLSFGLLYTVNAQNTNYPTVGPLIQLRLGFWLGPDK